jgi:integrase
VSEATRPGRQRAGDADPDLQFRTVAELEAVLRAIPDEVVIRKPKPTRRGRRGPAPPPPPDVLGPVLRVVILAAAMTGLRQSELLGLRWRDVDWVAQRIRERNSYVRGEHSGDGKSELSTKRSVPMADRLAGELDCWSKRTAYRVERDLASTAPSPPTRLASLKTIFKRPTHAPKPTWASGPETIVEVEALGGPTDATGNNPGNKLSESESS